MLEFWQDKKKHLSLKCSVFLLNELLTLYQKIIKENIPTPTPKKEILKIFTCSEVVETVAANPQKSLNKSLKLLIIFL